MSAESIKLIVRRAMTEPEFRGLLFRDPAQALKGYALTEAEAEALMKLAREEFDAMGGDLEARISKAAGSAACDTDDC